MTGYEKHCYEMQNYCHMCKRKFCYDKEDKSKYEVYHKVRDHCYYTGKFRGAVHNTCNLTYREQREIPVVLHNGSNYDYHLIIKELAEKFKGNIDCLGENTQKYITFSVPLKKEVKNKKLVTYKLKFIDSSRFMNTSLASLVDHLSKVGNTNFKKFMERYSTKSECQYIEHKNNNLIYKCEQCNKIYSRPISVLSKKSPTTYQFCNKNLDKFMLLLRKGVYPYEYMDDWERFDETSLPPQESFYSELYLEDITNEDYDHAKKVWDTFKIKNLGEYHDLYVQSDTLLLADIFKKFRNRCIKTYELDPAHFSSAPGLSWQACLKRQE